MGVNKQNTIKWFDNRKGKLTYSMTGSRNGVDGTSDCSGSITQAIKDAGAVPYDYLYSTVTLASYLDKNGYKLISANQDWDAQAGDIILMSWGPSMAYSGGAGGHVGVMKDDKTFISVDYWTGGQRGTAVSEHDWNHYYAVNAPMYIEAWRLEDKSSPAPNKPTNKPSKPQSAPSNTTGQKVNQGIYRADDLQKVNGIWQVRCNFLVPTEFNWTDNGISVDDIVLVDSNGYILKDQTTKTGSLFVFNTNYIKSVSSAQTGSVGYKWCQVNLSHSDNIWLSVLDKNDLIHKVSNA